MRNLANMGFSCSKVFSFARFFGGVGGGADVRVVMDRDRRLTGFLRGQTDKVEAPLGFELNNPWRVGFSRRWVLWCADLMSSARRGLFEGTGFGCRLINLRCNINHSKTLIAYSQRF